jgi:hypothetical protein
LQVRITKLSSSPCEPDSRNRLKSGTSVSEKISEPISADTTVYAIGAKIRPS